MPRADDRKVRSLYFTKRGIKEFLRTLLLLFKRNSLFPVIIYHLPSSTIAKREAKETSMVITSQLIDDYKFF